MRSSLSATRWSPRRSKRPITSPMRRRCTPSGLTRTRVRSTLTARKSDRPTSDRDRLLEARLTAERSDHRGSQPGTEQSSRELADLHGIDRFEARHQLIGLHDLPLEQELLTGVLAEGRRAFELEQEA